QSGKKKTESNMSSRALKHVIPSEARDLQLSCLTHCRSLASFGTTNIDDYSGGRFGTTGVDGPTPVKPFTFGGSLGLSPAFAFVESGESSPKSTRPLAGRFLTAVRQCVAPRVGAARGPHSPLPH